MSKLDLLAPNTRIVALEAVEGELAPGTQVDRYEIIGTLGSGACGIVYAARHVHLEQSTALKLLHPRLMSSEERVSRFFREARAAAAVGNQHIVRVSDCGISTEGMPFLAMELLKGVPLESLLEDDKALAAGRAVDIALQTLDGLAAAHDAGVVHRDLKPDNIYLIKHPESEQGEFVKLLDFGISKILAVDYGKVLTGNDALLGTPRYMAPEQFQRAHDVDHRADLFAAAVVLFQMLSGTFPFDGSSPFELVRAALTQSPKSLQAVAPHVPEAVCAVVYRGLACNPGSRWPDAETFSDALRSAYELGAIPAGLDPLSSGAKTISDPSTEMFALSAELAAIAASAAAPEIRASEPEESEFDSAETLRADGVEKLVENDPSEEVPRSGSGTLLGAPAARKVAPAPAPAEPESEPAPVDPAESNGADWSAPPGPTGAEAAEEGPPRSDNLPEPSPDPVGAVPVADDLPTTETPAPEVEPPQSLPRKRGLSLWKLLIIFFVTGCLGGLIALAIVLGQSWLGGGTGDGIPAGAVQFSPLRLDGNVDQAAVSTVLDAARPGINVCRDPHQTVVVSLELQVAAPGAAAGRLAAVRAAPGFHARGDVVQCCAGAIRSALPSGWDPGVGSGSVYFEVTLLER